MVGDSEPWATDGGAEAAAPGSGTVCGDGSAAGDHPAEVRTATSGPSGGDVNDVVVGAGRRPCAWLAGGNGPTPDAGPTTGPGAGYVRGATTGAGIE